MTDLEQFKDQLGNELVAAAHRRARVLPDLRVPRRRLAPLATVCMLGLAAAILAPFVRPSSVDAETFEITSSEQITRLEIVDLIVRPETAEQQLWREVAIESEFTAVPTDSEHVGRIVSVGSTGSVQVALHADQRGFPSTIDVPTNFDGVLTVGYGRLAQPGEKYFATAPHRTCQELFGQTLDASLEDLRAIRSTVVARIDLPDQRRDISDLSLIPDGYVITTVHTVSDEIVRVSLSPTPLTADQLDHGCRH